MFFQASAGSTFTSNDYELPTKVSLVDDEKAVVQFAKLGDKPREWSEVVECFYRIDTRNDGTGTGKITECKLFPLVPTLHVPTDEGKPNLNTVTHSSKIDIDDDVAERKLGVENITYRMPSDTTIVKDGYGTWTVSDKYLSYPVQTHATFAKDAAKIWVWGGTDSQVSPEGNRGALPIGDIPTAPDCTVSYMLPKHAFMCGHLSNFCDPDTTQRLEIAIHHLFGTNIDKSLSHLEVSELEEIAKGAGNKSEVSLGKTNWILRMQNGLKSPSQSRQSSQSETDHQSNSPTTTRGRLNKLWVNVSNLSGMNSRTASPAPTDQG